MRSYSVTVQTSATPICPTATELSARPNQQFAGTSRNPAGIHVANTGANTVYLGGPDVTTANGFPLAVGASIEIDMQSDLLYGIVAAATETVAVLRTS